MKKLEKQKLNEVEGLLYNVNTYISLHFIGMGRKPTEEELMKMNDALATCIRQLRNMQ